jgi:elongation factor 2
MAKKEQIVEMAVKLMNSRETIRNIGIVAHIDHGKTTLTDNLIAAAGLISEELAGKQCFMDYYELEQERGITINAANISLVHNIDGKDYLVNVIDTPGHVDFGGEVIRAMRAVDGVVLVVDSVEGVMPQTETVIRQALRENVRPSLFINKVDRLFNELQVTEEQMQERFVKTIMQVNKLIQKNAPEQFKEKWLVKVQDSSVTFGSAYNNWAINFDTMKKNNITFKDVYNYCKEKKQKELAQKSQLHIAMLGMVAKHLPSPLEAQKYRIPKIWSGEIESEEGQAMLNCDPKGPVAMMINDVSVDPHAGDVATGRVYSGTVKKGVQVHLIASQKTIVIQQVAIMMGPERVTVEEIPAGNIASIIGAKEVYSGETVSTKKIKEFENFMSSTEPVMTVSVEPKSTKDLPKLIEVIRQITKEDPNVQATLNQETGEHLLSGMGELHLDVTKYRIEVDHKVPIIVGTPIVVYRETITADSPIVEGKSPNKHNKFKLRVEKLDEEFLGKLVESKLNLKIRELKDKEVVEKLINMGLPRDEAKKAWCIHNNNILIDASRGVQALFEVKELIIQAFQDAMKEGPLAKEKCFGIKVVLEDATLHEDAIHRGPAQVLPAITRACYAAMLSAEPILLEPKQILTINVPESFMGAASRELGSMRTQISEMRTEGDTTIIIAKAPVKELIGFSAKIRSATEGRAIWTAEYAGYEKLPKELQKTTIAEIRKRKGMEPEPKPASFFMD